MKNFFITLVAVCAAAAITFSTTSCSKNDDDEPKEDITPSTGADGTLFVLNEGSFQFPSATLSVYNPETNEILNEAFFKANGMKLGDVAFSMTITNDSTGWVVVNNSNVVFAINPVTQKEKGRITGLTSPRYFHQVNDKKAYITQMYDNRIAIVDPSTYSITGYIEVPGMEPATGSTEQMVAYGDYVLCNCWSYQKSIIKIDTRTDQVVASKEVGIQPRCIALDCNDKLWALTDGGGWDQNPIGYEAPTLVKIDPETFNIEKKYEFELGDYCSKLCLNGKGDALYWIKGDIWKMDVNATALPTEAYIKSNASVYYGLTIAPVSNEVYVADAIDYSQNGVVYRYSPEGKLLDQFNAGINPGGFCWYKP